ncbi:hypothetical protein DFH06DRAFT_1058831 [Mycena polygramma]|nr:hypothetical protein DFH06DRAFT_1058831 [Mycena polygramma]
MKPAVQKENFPAKDPRTTWSQEEKHSVRQTKVASAPLRSIIKNAPATSYMPPATKTPSEPVDDPLASPAFFMSPAETLLESTGPNADSISFHDLIEAYNTFSLRIKSQIRVIMEAEASPCSLVSLKEYSHQLSEALQRDLKRARDEPLSQSRRTSFAQDSFQTNPEMDEEEIRVARELALLSQQLLCFLSNIFSFRPLYSIFSTKDLRSILSELLVLGSTPSIASPTSRRTWTFVVWILSVQTLPSEVLLPAKRELVSVLKRALQGQMGKDQAKLDGLQASNHLLKQFPSLFISPLSTILPCILQNLIADSPMIRVQALNALGRFALAKINNPSSASGCHASISASLSTFIDAQTCKTKSVRLRTLVNAGLAARNPVHPAQSPWWAVQLLASLAILMGDSIFSNPLAIKFTLQTLGQLSVHKQKLVVILHAYVWKCLVWVFSRLPTPTPSDGNDTRKPIFLTLKQDLRGGIGLALALSLLGTAPYDGSRDTSDSVAKVLEVVKDMMSHGDQHIQAEGVALLTQLLYTPIPSPASAGAHFDILVPQLFDGSLLHQSRDSVITAVKSLPRLDPSHVRQLADPEILYHWDDLAELWVKATNISLTQEFTQSKLKAPYLSISEYRENLLHGWQSLLLTPSDLTQGFAHLTTQDPFANKIAALICSFIVPTETVDSQVQRLVLVRKMWHTMTNVFQRTWLSWPAETVLGAVLKEGYNLADEQIRTAWAELCSELLSLGLPSAVGVVRDRGEAQMPSELQRQLWMLAVKSIHKSDVPAPWRDVAYLLSIPLELAPCLTVCMILTHHRAWTMTKSEAEIWGRLLRTSIPRDDTIQPTEFVEHILENVKDGHKLSDSPQEVLVLLSYVDLAGSSALPQAITSALAQVLGDLYPAQALLSTSLQFIRRLQDIVLSTPSSLALPHLLILQDSLCKWLEDEENLLASDVRNEITQCLFSTPLSIIHDLEPSGQNLVSISRFLATVADADAFERFWRVTYHGRDEFRHLYPESTKTSLRAFADVFGGSLAADLSLENHSQMESSCAPDSQPSQAIPSSSMDYYADESRYPFETQTVGMGDTHFMDVDVHENSASTVRPPSPSPPPPSVDPFVPPAHARAVSSALDQLQEYSSRLDESSVSLKDGASGSSHSSATVHGSTSRVQLNPNTGTEAGSSKRPVEHDDTWVSKRRRTSPEAIFKRRESNAIAGPSRLPGESFSEPVTRRQSVAVSEHALSQPIPSRKRKGKRKLILDYVEVPTYEEIRRRRQQCSLPTPSPSFRPPPARQPQHVDEEEEDYASWEAGLSIAEVKDAQQAFGCSIEYPSSDDGESSSPRMDTVSHSTSQSHRSQTAPIPQRERHPLPLRRNQTSARLTALQRALAVVADDASQPPVEDLMHASRLVHEIGAALNAQMRRELKKP